MLEITGRCIWITGASSGIGRELALALCKMGNFVIVSARGKEALQSLVLAAQGRMMALPIDLSQDGEELVEYANQLANITDYIDMVICCAGICEYEDDLSFDPEMYKRVMDTNFLGVVRSFKLALPFLKKSSFAPQFVAVGSLSAVMPLPRAEAYGASKAALEYFIGSVRADVVHLPLSVSLVRPGFVKTPMTEKNNFSMPFMLDVDRAVAIILRGIAKKKPVIDFPKRLSWSLRMGNIFFIAWCRWLAPKVTRISSAAWKE